MHPFIYSIVCLMTGPQLLLKKILHTVQSSVSSFNFQCFLVALRSSNSCLRLIHCLPVTSIHSSVFPIVCFRRQLLHKMWPIQLAFLLFIASRIFLYSLTLCNTSSFLKWLVQLIFSILLQNHISKLPSYFWSTLWSVQVLAPHNAVYQMYYITGCFLNWHRRVYYRIVCYKVKPISIEDNIYVIHCTPH
jgi:hypothetical protein